jgi:ABC-2 type transport system ATP-binding protein
VQPIREKHVLLITCVNGVNDLSDRLAEEFPGHNFTIPEPGLIRVEAAAPIRVGPLVRFLEERGAEVAEARRVRPSLEDVFVRITGVGADVMRKEKEKSGGNQ